MAVHVVVRVVGTVGQGKKGIGVEMAQYRPEKDTDRNPESRSTRLGRHAFARYGVGIGELIHRSTGIHRWYGIHCKPRSSLSISISRPTIACKAENVSAPSPWSPSLQASMQSQLSGKRVSPGIHAKVPTYPRTRGASLSSFITSRTRPMLLLDQCISVLARYPIEQYQP